MNFSFSLLPERFKEKIYIEPNTSCWLWLWYVNKDGYARGKGHLIHRTIYKWFCGPIPAGKESDHLCRTRCCVNPAHIEPVTPDENRRRGNLHLTWFKKKTQTHCIRGHPFDEANTYFNKGKRVCRTCRRTSRTKSIYSPGKYPGSIAMLNATKTHCPRGHPYDETNTIFHAGSRECRICCNERSRRHYLQRKGG